MLSDLRLKFPNDFQEKITQLEEEKKRITTFTDSLRMRIKQLEAHAGLLARCDLARKDRDRKKSEYLSMFVDNQTPNHRRTHSLI